MDKVTVKMEVDRKDLKDLYAAFKNLDEDTNAALKVEVHSLSSYVAREIQMEAYGVPSMQGQSVAIARSVRANKDRIPNITIGGSARAQVTRKGTPKNPLPKMGELLFGNEFGGKEKSFFANGGRRFPKWSGRYGSGTRGRWIFPTLRRLQPKITNDYHAIIDRYIRRIW